MCTVLHIDLLVNGEGIHLLCFFKFSVSFYLTCISLPRALSSSVVCVGAASIGKGIGGILFSRFSRSSSQPSVSLGLEEGAATAEGEEPKKADSQSAYSLSTMAQSGPAVADTSRTFTSTDLSVSRSILILDLYKLLSSILF